MAELFLARCGVPIDCTGQTVLTPAHASDAAKLDYPLTEAGKQLNLIKPIHTQPIEIEDSDLMDAIWKLARTECKQTGLI
jgi:hypothetical protein